MSKGKVDRSLKSLNMKWLVMLATFDVAAVLLFVAPELVKDASWSNVAAMRGLTALVLPVIVLLLTGLLSHDAKAALITWKLKNRYPGCEAFTRHGPADARVDMVALKKNVGAMPSDPTEQNKKWFKLFRLVEDDVAVLEAHKAYLMYRDMAAMSVLLSALAPLALAFTGASWGAVLGSVAFSLVQYLACRTGALNSGERFVCTVLAIHSTRKITGAAPASPRASKGAVTTR